VKRFQKKPGEQPGWNAALLNEETIEGHHLAYVGAGEPESVTAAAREFLFGQFSPYGFSVLWAAYVPSMNRNLSPASESIMSRRIVKLMALARRNRSASPYMDMPSRRHETLTPWR
jgi:hypothetical protein